MGLAYIGADGVVKLCPDEYVVTIDRYGATKKVTAKRTRGGRVVEGL